MIEYLCLSQSYVIIVDEETEGNRNVSLEVLFIRPLNNQIGALKIALWDRYRI
jgi:hypothetical protein